MGLVEKIQELCSSKETTLIGLEREIGLGRGTIRKWNQYSPSIDKLQKVADYFGVTTDSLLTDLDREILKLIRILTISDKTTSYFHPAIIGIMQRESENLRREYYDVPFEFNPQDMQLLLRETDLSKEFKQDFLKMLERVMTEIIKKDWSNESLSPEEQKAKNNYIQYLRSNIELNKNIVPELTEIEFDLITHFRKLPTLGQQAVLNMIDSLEKMNEVKNEQASSGEKEVG